jgi:hypothetical protein
MCTFAQVIKRVTECCEEHMLLSHKGQTFSFLFYVGLRLDLSTWRKKIYL